MNCPSRDVQASLKRQDTFKSAELSFALFLHSETTNRTENLHASKEGLTFSFRPLSNKAGQVILTFCSHILRPK